MRREHIYNDNNNAAGPASDLLTCDDMSVFFFFQLETWYIFFFSVTITKQNSLIVSDDFILSISQLLMVAPCRSISKPL